MRHYKTEDDLLREIARGAIERHIGDLVPDGATADRIYGEAYVLAFDALFNLCPLNTARRIAEGEAQKVAQL